MKKHTDKKLIQFKTVRWGSLLVFVAAFFIAEYILKNQDFFSQRFEVIIEWLKSFEIEISQMDTKFEVLLVIMALFLAKCFLPLPINTVCIISGMVFELPYAFLINMTGMMIEITLKYQEGRWLGGGSAHKILKKNEIIRKALEFDGSGNPILLFIFRLVPIFPPNLISKLYGAMRCSYPQYMLLSLIGMAPKIYGYTRIGGAVFNPFSKEFLMILMFMIQLSGLSALGFNIYYEFKSRQMKTAEKKK